MAPLEVDDTPKIYTSIEHGALIVTAVVAWTDQAPLHLALSAVIEEKEGTKSYWALKHPPGKPDFHHPDCFALTLPATAQK